MAPDFSAMIGKIQAQLKSLAKLREGLEATLASEQAKNDATLNAINADIKQKTDNFRRLREQTQINIANLQEARANAANAGNWGQVNRINKRIRAQRRAVTIQRHDVNNQIQGLKSQKDAQVKAFTQVSEDIRKQLSANKSQTDEGKANVEYLYGSSKKIREDAELDAKAKMETVTKGLIGSFAALNQVLQVSNNIYRIQTQKQLSLMNNSTLDASIADKRAAAEMAGGVGQLGGAAIGFAVGGPIGAAVGAAAGGIVKSIMDIQIARLERQRDMENASRQKVQTLAGLDPGIAATKALMDVNKTMMGLQEARRLSPILQEYGKVQMQLDQLRLQQSMNENIKNMADNIRKMREEMANINAQNYYEEGASEGYKAGFDILKLGSGGMFNSKDIDEALGGKAAQYKQDMDKKKEDARKRSESTWKGLTDTLRRGVDRAEGKARGMKGMASPEPADTKPIQNLMGG